MVPRESKLISGNEDTFLSGLFQMYLETPNTYMLTMGYVSEVFPSANCYITAAKLWDYIKTVPIWGP